MTSKEKNIINIKIANYCSKEEIFTTKDICDIFKIPRHKLQYLFDARKISGIKKTGTGLRLYTKQDINRIREVLFDMP